MQRPKRTFYTKGAKPKYLYSSKYFRSASHSYLLICKFEDSRCSNIKLSLMKIFEVTSKHLTFHSLTMRPMDQRFPKRVKAYQMYLIKMNVKRNQNPDIWRYKKDDKNSLMSRLRKISDPYLKIILLL